jgi:hypothetical protein
METIFFLLANAGIGYLLHKQDRMTEKLDNLTQEVLLLKVNLPKRSTDIDKPL